MAEIYNHKEFFERARAGEFVGDKVTLVQKYVIDEVIRSGYADRGDEEETDWSVEGGYCFWESVGEYGPERIYEVERRG